MRVNRSACCQQTNRPWPQCISKALDTVRTATLRPLYGLARPNILKKLYSVIMLSDLEI
jgi:hypothetical protein